MTNISRRVLCILQPKLRNCSRIWGLEMTSKRRSFEPFAAETASCGRNCYFAKGLYRKLSLNILNNVSSSTPSKRDCSAPA
jgi:hypothetical protein